MAALALVVAGCGGGSSDDKPAARPAAAAPTEAKVEQLIKERGYDEADDIESVDCIREQATRYDCVAFVYDVGQVSFTATCNAAECHWREN